MIPPIEPSDDRERRNLAAALAVIRAGESSGSYVALVGGGSFRSYIDHPYITGEFAGIRRADGRLTTAAGAYQITVTTWRDIGGIGRFGSFDPLAQDRAAVFLIRRRNALDAVLRGDVAAWCRLLRDEWEFLTLPRWSVDNVVSHFTANGGALA